MALRHEPAAATSASALAALAAVALSAAAGVDAAGALWGVYDFQNSWTSTTDGVSSFDSAGGLNVAVANFFPDFCGAVQAGNMGSTFGSTGFLQNIWDNVHAVPLISWQPFCYDTSGTRVTPDDFTALVAAGDYDSYIDQWASDLQAFLNGDDGVAGTADDRRAYLRMAHEMNLYSSYPWGLDANAYVAFWQHVHGRFAAKGFLSTQLQWMWCPNNFGNAAPAGYYPGDDYVDWTCFDAYNGDGTSWASSPSAIVDQVLSQIAALAPSKPLAVGEFGCPASGAVSQTRTEWLSAFLDYMVDGGRAQLVSYFNAGDYVVSGDSGFAGALSGHALIASDASNPRVITDDQFLGSSSSGTTPTEASSASEGTSTTASSSSSASESASSAAASPGEAAASTASSSAYTGSSSGAGATSVGTTSAAATTRSTVSTTVAVVSSVATAAVSASSVLRSSSAYAGASSSAQAASTSSTTTPVTSRKRCRATASV